MCVCVYLYLCCITNYNGSTLVWNVYGIDTDNEQKEVSLARSFALLNEVNDNKDNE